MTLTGSVDWQYQREEEAAFIAGAFRPYHRQMDTVYDDADLDRPIARLATALLNRLDELAEAMAEWIQKEVPSYVDSELVPYDDLREDCRAQLRSILPRLCGPEAADISYARQSGRQRAALGVPLAKAMDAYRVGGRFIWEALVAEAQSTRSLDSQALVRAASRIWLILDDSRTRWPARTGTR